MKRKLIPFFLSAAVLLTSCSSSGNKTTDGSTTASDVSQTVSGSNQAESVSSAEETEQADGLTKTLQIYDGIDIIKEYDITPESPLWFIGEKLTTVAEMIDEEPEISDFYAGGMGWALEYNDFLLFSSDMEYDYARVTTVSPYTGCELFDGYRMGYLRLSELKDLLGNYDVEQNLASGYYVLASEFRFREDPQNYYSMVFSFENGYDTERCTMLTTYVSSEPVASTSGNYYDDGGYDDYYDDSYYDDYDYPDATEPTSGPYDEVIQNLHDRSDARSVMYNFYSCIDNHDTDGALACTTQTDDALTYSIQCAADPEAFYDTVPDETIKLLLKEVIMPMEDDYDSYYEIGDVGAADQMATAHITTNNISYYEAFKAIAWAMKDLTDYELEQYANEFADSYSGGPEPTSDDFTLFVLKKLAQKVSRSTVVLGKCFAYDIYLEKINGEWYVSGFSDNTDFIDMYLGCFSELAQNMNYISNLFTS